MKKLLFFIFVCLFSFLLKSSDSTEDTIENLVQFIQQKDTCLQEAQKFYNYFLEKYTYKTSVVRGNIEYIYTHISPYTDYGKISKFYDVISMIQRFENESSQEMKQYIKNINQTDRYGKTPLSYVQTSEMYNVLRS